jgi:hypothetical protein
MMSALNARQQIVIPAQAGIQSKALILTLR